MVWGGFSIKGLVDYHSFTKIMDGAYYIQIVQDHLIRNGRKQFARRCRLLQDNDPKHNSRIVKKFLDEEVSVSNWLPIKQSRWQWPIENLCSVIKRQPWETKTIKS